MHATIPKGIVGGFEFTFSKNFEGMERETIDGMFASAKEIKSNQSRFDSYSVKKQCINYIPYYLSGFARAHFFRTTFLETAVYQAQNDQLDSSWVES